MFQGIHNGHYLNWVTSREAIGLITKKPSTQIPMKLYNFLAVGGKPTIV